MESSMTTIVRDNERNEMSFWGQALLLFHKTWLTKRRQDLKKLFGELGVPIIYLAFLCLLVRLFNVKTYPRSDVSYETPQNIFMGDLSVEPIHVAPNTDFTRNFTSITMQSIWKLQSDDGTSLAFKYHETEEELVTIYGKDANFNIALVLPNNFSSSSMTFPYKIRMNPDLGMPSPSTKSQDLKTCRGRDSLLPSLEKVETCPVNGYFYSNFLALQALVEQAVHLNESSSKNSTQVPINLNVTMENYPKDEYNEGMPVVMRILIPLYSVLPLVQIVNNLLVLIVTEKEQKIKDGLRMVGVADAAYWFSWLGVYGLIVTMFAIAFTVIMYFMSVLSHFNPLILFLLFFFFGISVITFAFALTPLFHKPKTAGLVGTLVLQFLSLLFLVQTFVDGSGNTVLIPFRLISSLAFTTALDQACRYEYSGGIGWSDLMPGNRGDTILYSLMFLVFDIFFYSFLAFYLDNVLPNEFGVKKHPFFFLKPSFWVGSKSSSGEFSRLVDEREIHQGGLGSENDNMEPVPRNLQGHEAIRIRNISKTYTSWFSKESVQAVKNVSMNMYESQITAILGKNGAGKSSLFHILTGLVSPTDGSAVIFGLNSSESYDMARLRKMTGVCLQYDLHFNALTVEEHLKFYGKLRGLKNEQLTQEINTTIRELKLTDRRHVAADKLSGGQKRKLSVAISLIGDPKVILLDEPTAGLDPVSRRHLWSVLQQKKEGKVIILTTHFLDEADILADRKAIMHDGVLKCMGSSLFLKNRYGVGYCLTVELNDPAQDLSKCDALIKEWIPESLANRKIFANEVKYSLPHSEAGKFSSVFAQVEDSIQKGNSFKSYGVSMTTLEEVFLKISNDLEPVVTGEGHLDSEKNLMENLDAGDVQRNIATTLWALCKLRIRRLSRSPQGLFFMLIMPLVFMSIGLGVPTTGIKGESTLNLYDLSGIYDPSDLRVAVDQHGGEEFSKFLTSNHFIPLNYTGAYENLLEINKGIGTMAAVSILSDTLMDEPEVERELTLALRVNGTFVHSPGIMLGLITKHLNRISQGTTQLTYQPFAGRSNNAVGLPSLNSVFFLGIAFLSTSVGMVMEIVLDREIKARNHLRVNGLSFGLYFSSVFIVYGVLTLFLTLAVICMILIFQVEAFTNPYAMTVTSILLLLYIFPSLLFSAIFSYLFNRMDSAQSVYSQVATFFGFIPAIAVIVVDAVVVDQSKVVVRILHTLFSALDIFYIPYGIFYWIYKEYLIFKMMRKSDDEFSFNMYATPEILTLGICMIIQIPIFWVLLIVADVLKNGGNVSVALSSLFKGRRSNSAAVHVDDSSNESSVTDSDVVTENSRVENYFSGNNAIERDQVVVAVKTLRKTYPAKKKSQKAKKVLNGVSFMVEKGGVFGLLGHNGAGKTTTMKIITAEEAADQGKVQLCGYDVRSNVSEAFQKLGFCPQHDSLWDNITLREHLELYATIRGIPYAKRNELVEHFLQGLNIKEHEKKAAANLSGGTKRKLSYAMSMVGRPDVVLLDEPSTGMDPQSKRFLWNTVLGTFKDSRGAILTTHSMEEAEILCSRIAIMVNGNILCIGSPQHLKTKFGKGYSLEIKLKPDNSSSSVRQEMDGELPPSSSRRSTEAELFSRRLSMPMVQVDSQKAVPPEFAFVIENFPSAILVENFGNRANFSVPNDAIKSISQVFSLLQSLKSTNNVEEYSFSQTTLENVFLGFSTENDENEEH